MSRPFTATEKCLLLILTLLLIAVGYWKWVWQPIRNQIEEYQLAVAREQDALIGGFARMEQMKEMESALDVLFSQGDPKPIPVYDNSAGLLRELHTVLEGTARYTIEFEQVRPLADSTLLQRPARVTFAVADYPQAMQAVEQLSHMENCGRISDLNLTDSGSAAPESVKVSLVITFYEREEMP